LLYAEHPLANACYHLHPFLTDYKFVPLFLIQKDLKTFQHKGRHKYCPDFRVLLACFKREGEGFVDDKEKRLHGT
jgi:hypothetical protein